MKVFLAKLESFLLILFLILIPTQLGKHFWPPWSNVLGIRIDYLSPVLYLVDLVWMGWLAMKLFRRREEIKLAKITEQLNFENFILLLVVVLNILVASNKWIAMYKWLRIGQWWITILNLQTSNFKKYLKWIIPCWIMGETLLGLSQIVSGGSLGGIFYWLGERRFNFNTVGIAQISVLGEGLLRAYGTFSHPNSLAGFLLVCWLLWSRYKDKGDRTIWFWIVWWMGLIGIFISGSRIVWLLALVTLLKEINIKKILLASFLIAGVLWIVSWNYRVVDFVGGWDVNSLEKRINLNMAALGMIKENIMLGVGAGNFLVKLPQYQWQRRFFWLQPAHNIFLLALTEIGSLGILILGYKFLKNNQTLWAKKNWWILIVIAVTGMVDHYWLTLPQNGWLLTVILAIF